MSDIYRKFSFDPHTKGEAIVVNHGDSYDETKGFGFDFGTCYSKLDSDETDRKPFYFSVRLPKGNYDVEVILGDRALKGDTSIKVETRMLICKPIHTEPGQFVKHKFSVNIKALQTGDPPKFKLEKQESSRLNWDDILTLEINGSNPAVHSLEIKENKSCKVMYLAGNSTLADQANEPYASWGQMITQYFREGTALANYAKSGMSVRSFITEGRFYELLNQMKPKDLLLMDFGHIDKKEIVINPLETFVKGLVFCIQNIRKQGGVPILVTPVNRNIFNKDGRLANSLGDFPEAMRKLSKKMRVPLIDQNLFSKFFFESLGPDKCNNVFCSCPANTWPDQPVPLDDRSHLSNYGAYVMAYFIVSKLCRLFPGIKPNLYCDLLSENHSDIQKFNVPLSPFLPQFKNYHIKRRD